jgi:hypothetical protein
MIYVSKEFNLFNEDIKADFILSRYEEDEKIHIMLRMEDKRYDICAFHSLGVLNDNFGLSKNKDYDIDKRYWYAPTIEAIGEKGEIIGDICLNLARMRLNIPMRVLDIILDYAKLLEKSSNSYDSNDIMSVFDRMYWHVEEF